MNRIQTDIYYVALLFLTSLPLASPTPVMNGKNFLFFFFPLKEERAWSCQKFWVGLLSPYSFILSWMRKEYGRLHCCIHSEYLFLANTLYQFGKAAIIKIPHTGWLNINLFSHNSGSQNFKVRCLPVWFLLRPLFLAYRWLLPCCVLTWPLFSAQTLLVFLFLLRTPIIFH